MSKLYALIGALVAGIGVGGYDELKIYSLEQQLGATQQRLAIALAQPKQPAPAVPDVTAKPPTEPSENRLQAQRAVEFAIARREALWNKTYVRSATCDNPPDNAAFIECGNTYVTAHKRFNDSHPITAFIDADTR